MPMIPSRQLTWVSYFYTGAAALFISWVFSGCRFGNKVEQPTNSNNQQAQQVWYYLTQPKELKVCVGAGAEDSCQSPSLENLPTGRPQVMTNPVAIVPDTAEEGYMVAVDPKTPALLTQLAIETFLYKDGSLGIEGWSRSFRTWIDTDQCTWQDYVRETGMRKESSTAQAEAKSQGFSSKLKIAGHLSMKFEYIRAFQGDCSASLQKMHACYENRNDCGGASDNENRELQGIVQDHFNYFIETGAMQVGDIPKIEKLSYTVSYE